VSVSVKQVNERTPGKEVSLRTTFGLFFSVSFCAAAAASTAAVCAAFCIAFAVAPLAAYERTNNLLSLSMFLRRRKLNSENGKSLTCAGCVRVHKPTLSFFLSFFLSFSLSIRSIVKSCCWVDTLSARRRWSIDI
jgi:hypothetical protein